MLPRYDELYGFFLRAVEDGAAHGKKEVLAKIASELKLSAADLAERLPSGRQTVFDNRVGWASTYLKKAGLIVSPSRGAYAITDEGKKALSGGSAVDNGYLGRFESFVAFIKRDFASGPTPPDPPPPGESPAEALERAYKTLTDALASELLDEVTKLSPREFERLVLKLPLKMGYGSGVEDSARTTLTSRDEGIDGVVKEDRLGFSSIYIQAKKWDPAAGSVGRPEVRRFAGAPRGRKGRKGLFITTGTFTREARDFVDKIDSSIVPIDGGQLARLMIRHNLGVSVEFTYEVKRVDSDFFGEML